MCTLLHIFNSSMEDKNKALWQFITLLIIILVITIVVLKFLLNDPQ